MMIIDELNLVFTRLEDCVASRGKRRFITMRLKRVFDDLKYLGLNSFEVKIQSL